MRAWKRFFWTLVASFLAGAACIYAFIFVVDPFDTLHLSPRLERGPVATNARFSFPALARSPRFDSAILGTSTSRMLRPDQLNGLFGARFANLSMNDARAYEQYRLGLVFAAAHPEAKYLLIGIDDVWCVQGDTYARFSPRPFPEWMYDANPWNDYREHFSLYALEQAVRQFAELTALVPRRYGRNGYTSFLPPESAYDVARARTHLYPNGSRPVASVTPAVEMSEAELAALKFPTHPLLAALLEALPAQTRVILFFVPYHAVKLPPRGSKAAIVLEECKARITAIAAKRGNAAVADFMIASPTTREDSNYWDILHYREAIAAWLGERLHEAALGRRTQAEAGYVLRHAAQ